MNPKQKEVTLLKDGLTPDVLNSTNCVNCNRWENKYVKAKQTLAATLEKLQAANVRKEKVDRALSKELGKTHNILSQVKRIKITNFNIYIYVMIFCRLEVFLNRQIMPAIKF